MDRENPQWLPQLRAQIIDSLRMLCDPVLQREKWLGPPGELIESLDQEVHTLFDDTDLHDDPESCIGWYLRDQHEVRVIRKLTHQLEEVLDDVMEINAADEVYLNHREWSLVVRAAQEALAVFLENEERYVAPL